MFGRSGNEFRCAFTFEKGFTTEAQSFFEITKQTKITKHTKRTSLCGSSASLR